MNEHNTALSLLPPSHRRPVQTAYKSMIHPRLHSHRGRHLYSQARRCLSTNHLSYKPWVSQLSDLFNIKLGIISVLHACAINLYLCLYLSEWCAATSIGNLLQRSVFVGEERSFQEQRQPGRAEAAHELVMVLLFLTVVLSRTHTHTLLLSNSLSQILTHLFPDPVRIFHVDVDHVLPSIHPLTHSLPVLASPACVLTCN